MPPPTACSSRVSHCRSRPDARTISPGRKATKASSPRQWQPCRSGMCRLCPNRRPMQSLTQSRPRPRRRRPKNPSVVLLRQPCRQPRRRLSPRDRRTVLRAHRLRSAVQATHWVGGASAAASSIPSGICRRRARIGALRGSPTPPEIGRAVYRRRQTPSGPTSHRRWCRR